MDINQINETIKNLDIQIATLENNKKGLQIQLENIQEPNLVALYQEINNPNTSLDRLLEIEKTLVGQISSLTTQVNNLSNEVSKYVN